MHHSGLALVNIFSVLEAGHLHAGMTVADFGCGLTGHLTFSAAKIVGETGLIFAVDKNLAVGKTLTNRAQHLGLKQVQVVRGDFTVLQGSGLPNGTADVVFLLNVLSQVVPENRPAVLFEALRVLKPKGRLVIGDWQKNYLSFSPPAKMMVDWINLIKQARLLGLAVPKKFSVGPHHAGVVFFRA